MEFVKEFATFLHEKGIIKFGDFTLASGKKSQYYIDLRLVASYPHEFRKMIKQLQNKISDDYENIDRSYKSIYNLFEINHLFKLGGLICLNI